MTALAVECSPRERGWSLREMQPQFPLTVLPARAGMVPGRSAVCARWCGAPRASGDGPSFREGSIARPACSPRERGWSRRGSRPDSRPRVLPARAGMTPSRVTSWETPMSLDER